MITKGMTAIFEKMLRSFTWYELEERGEDFRGSNTFLLFKMQIEESNELSLRGFVVSKSKKKGFLDPALDGRLHPIIHGRVLLVEEEKFTQFTTNCRSTLLLSVEFWTSGV